MRRILEDKKPTSLFSNECTDNQGSHVRPVFVRSEFPTSASGTSKRYPDGGALAVDFSSSSARVRRGCRLLKSGMPLTWDRARTVSLFVVRKVCVVFPLSYFCLGCVCEALFIVCVHDGRVLLISGIKQVVNRNP